MAENEAVKNNRERYIERLKAKYPDREFADDEEIFGQINDDYDGYDAQIGEMGEREKAMADLFASNPRAAAFLTSWRKGENPFVSFVRIFGPEAKAAFEDQEELKKFEEATEDYAKRVEEEGVLAKEQEENLAKSKETIKRIMEERGLDDDQIDMAMEYLLTVTRDVMRGNFTEEIITMALNAINHDKDVEEAQYEGEVRGRNTKIEEKLRKRGSSDGTADLAGTNGSGAGRGRKAMSIFDWANQAK